MGWIKVQGSRFKVQGSGFKVEVAASPPFLEDGILVSQPSPLGEGAPQGRIGHKRHERQMRKAEKCAPYVGKA